MWVTVRGFAYVSYRGVEPETLVKRQATLHNCFPSFLGDGSKWIEVVYGEEKKCFVLGRLKQPRQDKNLLYRHDEPKEPNKEGPLSFVLVESPFASVSTGAPPRVTKRYRLSWLTNVALVYEPKCWRREGVAGSQPTSTAVHRSPNKLRSNYLHN